MKQTQVAKQGGKAGSEQKSGDPRLAAFPIQRGERQQLPQRRHRHRRGSTRATGARSDNLDGGVANGREEFPA